MSAQKWIPIPLIEICWDILLVNLQVLAVALNKNHWIILLGPRIPVQISIAIHSVDVKTIH